MALFVALGVDLPSGVPFRCKHRIEHRKRARGERGLRVGANLLGRNLHGNQIAWKYRVCAGHEDLLFRDGVQRQAGKCDCLLEFTSRPELALGAARESGHNSICQNGLKILLRETVGMVQTQVTAQGWLGSAPEGRRPQIRGWRAGGSLAVASSTPATPRGRSVLLPENPTI